MYLLFLFLLVVDNRKFLLECGVFDDNVGIPMLRRSRYTSYFLWSRYKYIVLLMLKSVFRSDNFRYGSCLWLVVLFWGDGLYALLVSREGQELT